MEVLEFGTGDIGALERPVMLVGLEGWFDVASAATQAVDAFISADYAVTVGSIDPDPFYDFTQQRPHVSIDDDIREIVWPSNEFVLQRNPGHRDVVGLIGVEPHLYWKTYVEAIVVVAEALGCEAVVTVGSGAEAIPHSAHRPSPGARPMPTSPDDSASSRRATRASPAWPACCRPSWRRAISRRCRCASVSRTT